MHKVVHKLYLLVRSESTNAAESQVSSQFSAG